MARQVQSPVKGKWGNLYHFSPRKARQPGFFIGIMNFVTFSLCPLIFEIRYFLNQLNETYRDNIQVGAKYPSDQCSPVFIKEISVNKIKVSKLERRKHVVIKDDQSAALSFIRDLDVFIQYACRKRDLRSVRHHY